MRRCDQGAPKVGQRKPVGQGGRVMAGHQLRVEYLPGLGMLQVALSRIIGVAGAMDVNIANQAHQRATTHGCGQHRGRHADLGAAKQSVRDVPRLRVRMPSRMGATGGHQGSSGSTCGYPWRPAPKDATPWLAAPWLSAPDVRRLRRDSGLFGECRTHLGPRRRLRRTTTPNAEAERRGRRFSGHRPGRSARHRRRTPSAPARSG